MRALLPAIAGAFAAHPRAALRGHVQALHNLALPHAAGKEAAGEPQPSSKWARIVALLGDPAAKEALPSQRRDLGGLRLREAEIQTDGWTHWQLNYVQ
ncbi:MAG: hypothetical protein ACK5ZW_15105 [Betaproteobacteria bacterium]